MTRRIRQQPRRSGFVLLATAIVLSAVLSAMLPGSRALATSGDSPYTIPFVTDTNPDPNVVETTLTAETATVDIGNGVMAHAETFNGVDPRADVHAQRRRHGDRPLPEPPRTSATAIHWHGIELSNTMDGTPFTQNLVPPGGSFLYKFKVTRPGIFWYHPHHDPSDDSNTNQVFSGLYGMIVVTDPNEAAPPGLRDASCRQHQTKPLVLSDTTVCKTAGTNDAATYPNPGGNTLPWVGNPGGGTTPALPVQADPTPKTLCEAPTAIDGDGKPASGSYGAGDIPAIQQTVRRQRTNEGQTVLTNGKNVGARAGSPAAPGAPRCRARRPCTCVPARACVSSSLNASAIRFFRLRLTDDSGTSVPLIRVGGEGGLLDNAVEEGGTQRHMGSTRIRPRRDPAAARHRAPTSSRRFPPSATGVLTMWTEDYSRTGDGLLRHPDRSGHASRTSPGRRCRRPTRSRPARRCARPPATSCRSSARPTGTLLDPATFSAAEARAMPTPGRSRSRRRSDAGHRSASTARTASTTSRTTRPLRTWSTRRGTRKLGDTLELSVTNTTGGPPPVPPARVLDPADVALRSRRRRRSRGRTTSSATTSTFPAGLHAHVPAADRSTVRWPTASRRAARSAAGCSTATSSSTPRSACSSSSSSCRRTATERPDINVERHASVQVTPGDSRRPCTARTSIPTATPVTLSASVGTRARRRRRKLHVDVHRPAPPIAASSSTSPRPNADGLKDQVPFFLKIVNTAADAPRCPGRRPRTSTSTLSFGISADRPERGRHRLRSARPACPRALTFTDNGDRTGTGVRDDHRGSRPLRG